MGSLYKDKAGKKPDCWRNPQEIRQKRQWRQMREKSSLRPEVTIQNCSAHSIRTRATSKLPKKQEWPICLGETTEPSAWRAVAIGVRRAIKIKGGPPTSSLLTVSSLTAGGRHQKVLKEKPCFLSTIVLVASLLGDLPILALPSSPLLC